MDRVELGEHVAADPGICPSAMPPIWPLTCAGRRAPIPNWSLYREQQEGIRFDRMHEILEGSR